MCFLSLQAPSSLLEALEQHLASLEGKKVKDSTAASRCANPSVTTPRFLQARLFRSSECTCWVLKPCVSLQGQHLVECRVVASQHGDVLHQSGRAGEAGGPGRGAGPAQGSEGSSRRFTQHAGVGNAAPPRRPSLLECDASSQEQRLKELSKRPSFSTTDTSPISTTGGTISTAPAIDLFSTPSCSNG